MANKAWPCIGSYWWVGQLILDVILPTGTALLCLTFFYISYVCTVCISLEGHAFWFAGHAFCFVVFGPVSKAERKYGMGASLKAAAVLCGTFQTIYT